MDCIGTVASLPDCRFYKRTCFDIQQLIQNFSPKSQKMVRKFNVQNVTVRKFLKVMHSTEVADESAMQH